jgi:hypothetical protein
MGAVLTAGGINNEWTIKFNSGVVIQWLQYDDYVDILHVQRIEVNEH